MRWIVTYIHKMTLVLIMGLIITLLSVSQPVSAHATLEQVQPDKDAVVKQSPEKITMTFNEPVHTKHSGITLYDDKGKELEQLEPNETGSSKKLTFNVDHLDKGTHQVKWHAISADGHEVGNSYNFSVKEKTADKVDTTPPWYAQPSVWFGLVRYLAEGSVIVCVGLYLVNLLARRRGLRSYSILPQQPAVAWCAMMMMGLSALLYMMTLSSDVVQDLISLNKATLMQSPFILSAIAIIVFLYLWTLRHMHQSWYTLVPLVILIALSMSGHAWNQHIALWSIAIRVCHLLGMSLWLGALVYLVIDACQSTHRQSVPQVKAFLFKLNMSAVALLIASGVLMFFDQTHLSVLWSEVQTWSLLLIGKIILTILMMALGLYQTVRALGAQGRAKKGPLYTELLIGIVLILLGVIMSQINIPT